MKGIQKRTPTKQIIYFNSHLVSKEERRKTKQMRAFINSQFF